MANYHIAIKEINPNAAFYIVGDGEESLDNIEWLGDTTPIAKADIIAKEAELQAIEAAKPSIEERKASAKAKLMAGEPLTEDEANTIVL